MTPSVDPITYISPSVPTAMPAPISVLSVPYCFCQTISPLLVIFATRTSVSGLDLYWAPTPMYPVTYRFPDRSIAG